VHDAWLVLEQEVGVFRVVFGLLDVIASDYVPASLLQAALALTRARELSPKATRRTSALIAALYADTRKRQAMGAAARARAVSRFSVAAMAAAYRGLLHGEVSQ